MKTSEITDVITHLKNGGVIAYPTETVWGLGCDATNAEAVARVFDIKGRETTKAVSILVRDLDQARSLARVDEFIKKYLVTYWPGPVTFVLPATESVLPEIHGGTNFVGLRCSTYKPINDLLWNSKNPVVTTSANQSGQVPAKSADQLGWLPEEVLIWEPASVQVSDAQASTVVKIDGDKLTVLRQGAISLTEM